MKTLPNLMMFLLLFFSPLSFAQTQAHELSKEETLSCKINQAGYWEMLNSAGKIMSGSDYGVASQEVCEEEIKTRNGDLVCAWNGQSYRVANVNTGIGYGHNDPQYGYNKLATCSSQLAVHDKTKNVYCDWNGNHYIPFSIETHNALSSTTQGWNDASDCQKASELKSIPSAVCGWDNGSFLYTHDGNKINYPFKSNAACNGFLDIIRNMSNADHVIAQLKATDFSAAPTAIRNGIPNEDAGFAGWKKCEDPSRGYHLLKSKDNYIVDECRPDTLYSWGGYEKAVWFLSNLKNHSEWPHDLPRSLFTTTSPASTFGYGAIPLRFKIKASVQYKIVSPSSSTCDNAIANGEITKEDFLNTIIVRYVNLDPVSFLDYIICSPKVIESYSVAAPEHYDEIIRDDIWMRTKNYFLWEAYSKRNGVDRYLDNTLDSKLPEFQTDYSDENFRRTMAVLKLLATANAGSLISESGESKLSHFNTRMPVYFNPK